MALASQEYSQDLFTRWAQIVYPATLRYSRVIGSSSHFIVRVEWNEAHLDLPVILEDWRWDGYHSAQNLAEVEEMLDIMRGVLGANLPKLTQRKKVGGYYYGSAVQAAPRTWAEWERK